MADKKAISPRKKQPENRFCLIIAALFEHTRAMTALPQEIRLNSQRDTLTLVYADAEYALDAEFLRVYSPSAEVRGHGRGQERLQTGKRGVLIADLLPAGNYALKIVFSDGHDSGLYDWDYLLHLGQNRAALWQDYLDKLAAASASREPAAQPGSAPAQNCNSGTH